jgi:hypothetical protein
MAVFWVVAPCRLFTNVSSDICEPEYITTKAQGGCLLDCSAMQTGIGLRTFQRSVLPPSSGRLIFILTTVRTSNLNSTPVFVGGINCRGLAYIVHLLPNKCPKATDNVKGKKLWKTFLATELHLPSLYLDSKIDSLQNTFQRLWS